MNRKSLSIVLLLMAASFGVGRWRVRDVKAGEAHDSDGAMRAASAGETASDHRSILHYTCPMHPDYKSQKPGKAPCCGMDLVPVYAKQQARQSGRVFVSPDQQQLIGVRFGVAEQSSGAGVFRTSGRVVPDEAAVYRLTAKVDGWVRRIYPDSTGSLVRKGQPLLAIYSKDLQVAQQAYIFALNQMERFKSGDEPDAQDRLRQAINDAVLNLENFGVSQDQIAAIARDKRVRTELNLVAPATGFIAARNVYDGQRFDRGIDFYRIVDLNHVWILADVSDPQGREIEPGMTARVTAPQLPDTTLQARAGNVLPTFDANSRVLQLRLEAANPRYALKPDMYVDVEFAVRTPPGVVVPRDAVVDSGLGKIVFVEAGNGYFEPRPVRTGWRRGDRVEIASGLSAGERIVVSGAFLIDSESRMQAANARVHASPGESRD